MLVDNFFITINEPRLLKYCPSATFCQPKVSKHKLLLVTEQPINLPFLDGKIFLLTTSRRQDERTRWEMVTPAPALTITMALPLMAPWRKPALITSTIYPHINGKEQITKKTGNIQIMKFGIFFCQQNVSPGSSPASQFTPTVPIQPV